MVVEFMKSKMSAMTSCRHSWLAVTLSIAFFVLQCASGQAPSGAAQGDSFNSNANSSRCRQVYSQALAKISAHNIRIQDQWRRDQLDCNRDSKCIEQALNRRASEERSAYKEGVDAQAQKQLCEERTSAGNAIPKSEPCEEAYRQAMEKVAEHNIQIRADWYRGQADCKDNTNCIRQLQQKRIAAEQAVREESSNAAGQRVKCRLKGGNNGGTNISDPGPGAAQGGKNKQTDCFQNPAPAKQQEMRLSAREALRTFAAMGQQADIMLATMGKLTAGRLEYLAQPNVINQNLSAYFSQPSALNKSALDAAGAVVNYFSNEDSRVETNRILWSEAKKAADWASRHPAEAVGVVGDQILWSKIQAGGVNACEAGAIQLEGEISKTKKAIQRIRQAAAGQSSTHPPSPGSPCSVNPNFGVKNCLPSTVAYDMRRDSKFMWDESHFNWKQADGPPTWSSIGAMFRGLYGDRLYTGMSQQRLSDQMVGKMSDMVRADMERELLNAGEGARGLVYVRWPGDKATAHIFHGEVISNRIQYHDPQGGFDGLRNFEVLQRAGTPAGQERVLFYRTAGSDMLPIPPH